MPDQLTGPVDGTSTRGARPEIGGTVVEALVVVAIFLAAGALAGVVWFQLWSPPEGVVSDGQWFTDENGLRGAFSGTGLYLLVAVLAGFLVGALTAFLFDRSELVTLAAVLVGASLAGLVMLRLGLEWSPADPEVRARTAEDGAVLPGRLSVEVRHAWAAFPGGALVGMAVVFLTTTKRPPSR
ncbi:hypothetical protein [Nocardioides sp. SYSU DS0663]|uniref:hypothetical protein n=1 Tax=Nocardioides sp. SYSU DS0663 TaxID=3416445 RepID=UPI003F4CA8E0